MKWHKFLVYFSLWLGVVLNAVNGYKYLTGAVYGKDRNLVYQVIPGMKTPDLVYGLVSVAVGILGVCTAVSLLKFKAIGPKLLAWTYIIGAAGSLFYVVAGSNVLSKYNVDLGSTYVSLGITLVVSVVMVIVNSVYYKKRAHLFVN